METEDWVKAADAADELLAGADPGAVVVRDPAFVLENNEVFVFRRVPESMDDQMVVVNKSTGTARMQVSLPWEPRPFPDLSPVDGDFED